MRSIRYFGTRRLGYRVVRLLDRRRKSSHLSILWASGPDGNFGMTLTCPSQFILALSPSIEERTIFRSSAILHEIDATEEQEE
jgi:hypothetical protein